MLIDSNIIVYSLNDASVKQEKAQKFLQEHTHDSVIAHQNILESLRILTHPKFSNPMTTTMAIRAVGGIVSAFQIIYPNHETYHLAWVFIGKHALKADGVFDAYLAATALTNGVSVIATDNERHFRTLKEITVYNPFVQTSN